MTKKSEIEALVASELPDQNKREITPPRLRNVFLGFVNRAVLQDQDFPAANLTGTLADARLPTSQAGKTFTSPVQHASGTASLPGVTFAGDTDTGMFRPGANTLAWATGGVERGRIDASGRLLWVTDTPNPGIGNTNVGVSLGDNGAFAASRASGIPVFINRSTSHGEIARLSYDGNTLGQFLSASNAMTFQTVGANALILGAAGSERLRITSSGNVGIGTSSPSTRFHVDGTVRFQSLPTTDPGVSGALWNDGGTLKISA